jgi:uncharacterized iron-regulated membrane protein
MSTASIIPSNSPKGLDYHTVWRWHFYAGLFCIPFILWLAITGTIFLFHPQIQNWLDRPYNHLAITAPAVSANAQVQSAIAAVPGSSLVFYQLPTSPQSATQIVVGKGTEQYRVYVNPQTLQVLKIDNEDMRVMNFVFRLHGELLLGNTGSMIVELAASWAVVMIVSGLFLWWPRTGERVAGVFYPRLHQGQRVFWRDIHAATGVWISVFALFLLFTGLPWAKSWGSYLKAVRHIASGTAVKQDWSTSSADDKASCAGMNMGMTMGDSEHAEHMHRMSMPTAGPNAYIAIDRMVATVNVRTR